MKQYDIGDIRTIAVMGSQGSGKTTLMESLLHVTDAKPVKGSVEEENTTSDYLQEEKDHQMSLSMSVIPVEYDEHKFNFLDLAGHREFVSESFQALKVVKGAVVLLDGASGIDIGSEQVLEDLSDRNIPTIIFVNKMDKENVKFDKLLTDLNEFIGNKAVPFLWPIIEGDDFRGYVNLIDMKTRVLEDGKIVEKEVSEKMQEVVAEAREQIVESVAMSSEDLLDKYFGGEELSHDEITTGLRKGVISGELKPVVIGTALKNIGVRDLLEMIKDFLPAPNELKPITGKDPETEEEKSRNSTANEPFSGYVFKTVIDPFIGQMNFVKVYSGSLKKGDVIVVANTKDEVKINAINFMRGAEQLDASGLHAGDIGVINKLEELYTGCTIADPNDPIIFEPAHCPSPTIYVAVKPKQKRDEDKISTALHKLTSEDPAFEYKRNRETAQLLIGGQGMSHIKNTLEKMENRFKVEVEQHDQKIVYRETIKRKAESQGRHKKQSGGSGQFGVVDIRFEPIDPNEMEFEFDEEIHGGSVPKGYFPAVEKGLIEHFRKGPLAGFPVIGVRAVLYDGSYHPVDSNEISFKIAAALAFKNALKDAKPTLLEPVMKLEIVIRDEYVGDIIGDMNKRRGQVLGMEPLGNGKQQINAEVPEAEIVSYANDLNAMTQGTGTFQREFVRYEEVPGNLQAKIIEQAKADQEK